jgi:hypothetical protein
VGAPRTTVLGFAGAAGAAGATGAAGIGQSVTVRMAAYAAILLFVSVPAAGWHSAQTAAAG